MLCNDYEKHLQAKKEGQNLVRICYIYIRNLNQYEVGTYLTRLLYEM